MERELWSSLYAVATRLDTNFASWRFTAADILVVYFWAVMHDRPMSWAIDKGHWPDDLRPRLLPSQATLSRRMRRPETQQLMADIEQTWIALTVLSGFWLRMIDGKPLPVSGVSKDKDAGYGRGAGGMQKGYKLHAVWASGPLPLAWGLAAMNVSEKKMARYLIPSLPGSGYLLGDAEYDSNALYDLANQAEHQLLVPKRQKHRGVGHRPQSPHRLRSIHLMKTRFGKGLHRHRRQIEREFGTLTTFGGGLACLPAWARRFPRVRNWVHAKLLVNAARWLRNHPDALAVA
jgi:Transposase DDE domain